MLAYASARQQVARRGKSPSTLLLIIGGHVTAIALVMSAKMDLPERIWNHNPEVIMVPIKPPPPPEQTPLKPHTSPSVIDRVPTVVTTPRQDPIPIDTDLADNSDLGTIIGPKTPDLPILPQKIIDPVRVGPRLATPPSQLRPPYPASKLESQQEASLRLRLSIDEAGRVVAVDPVGPADPAFLNAARKHLIARWRYQPATVDGRGIASTTVITLRFELEG